MSQELDPAKLSYYSRLLEFVAESNRIEGIHRPPTAAEVEAHYRFLQLPHVGVADLERLVGTLQPDARLRRQDGCNVYVGNHVPPPGGARIELALAALCSSLHNPRSPEIAYRRHQEYETLHPFTDGNGRSGRALWLWDMGGPMQVPLGFLHTWYYQSLSSNRAGETYQWPST